MGKLTTYQFVEIFDETRTAGKASYTSRGGLLPVTEVAVVRSTFTGLFCADRDTLLIEATAVASVGMADVVIDELPEPIIEAVRDLNVTRAVRELPDRADEYHRRIAAACAASWPELNQPGDNES